MIRGRPYTTISVQCGHISGSEHISPREIITQGNIFRVSGIKYLEFMTEIGVGGLQRARNTPYDSFAVVEMYFQKHSKAFAELIRGEL